MRVEVIPQNLPNRVDDLRLGSAFRAVLRRREFLGQIELAKRVEGIQRAVAGFCRQQHPIAIRLAFLHLAVTSTHQILGDREEERRRIHARMLEQEPVLHQVDAMHQIDMRDLVAQQRRQFRLAIDQVQHSGCDVDMTTKNCPGVRISGVHNLEGPGQLLPPCLRRDPRTDSGDIGPVGRAARLPPVSSRNLVAVLDFQPGRDAHSLNDSVEVSEDVAPDLA